MSHEKQAHAHMSARWDYLGKKGWQGSFTFERYVAANNTAVMRNLVRGLVSDGAGFWIDPSTPNGARRMAVRAACGVSS